MKRMPLASMAGAFLLSGLLVLTGCGNGNLFGGLHKRGDSGNTEYLLSDAAVALNGKDYGAALSLYERVLSQDPNNSEALYGAAIAAIGGSGLNFGTILSNVISQSSSLSVQGLGDFVAQSRETIHSNSADPDSLLRGVDLAALNSVIDVAICRLNKIVVGRGDGKIAATDIDVIVNLGVLYTVRAVLKPLRLDLIDIKNVNGSYDVIVDPGLTTNVCNGSSLVGSFTSAGDQQAFIQGIITDVANGYALLNQAATILNLSSDRVIVKVREDVRDAVADFLTDPSMPAACVAQFNAAGITGVGSLSSWNDYIVNPPSGC